MRNVKEKQRDNRAETYCERKYEEMFDEIKKNSSFYALIFSSGWFFITLFTKVIIRLFFLGYYRSLKLDQKYFYYNDDNLVMCMFYAAFFLIALFGMCFLYNIILSKKKRLYFFTIGFVLTAGVYFIIPAKELLYMCVIKALLGMFLMGEVLLLLLSVVKYESKKYKASNFLFIVIVYLLVVMGLTCYKSYIDGGKVISNSPTFESAQLNDGGEQCSYIILWDKNDKICMRQIVYNENVKNLVISEDNVAVIGDDISEYVCSVHEFESVEIKKASELIFLKKHSDIVASVESEMSVASWQFEFVTLDDGIEYVAEKYGQDPLFLHTYTKESIGNQTYIVVNGDEYIMIDRDKINQSRCVNSYYREQENQTIWKLIDYRDFEKLKESIQE